LRACQGRQATGNDPLDHFRICAKGRRDLAGVEHSEASRRSRADVKNPAAAPEGGLGKLDGASNLIPLRCNDFGNSTIFSGYQVYDLEGSCEIDRGGTRVATLSFARV
jgi:hypothetical protein